MYPYAIFGHVSLYGIFFAVGLISALVLLRVLADCKRLPAKAINFYLIVSVVSIALGIGAAVLLQAVYNAIAGDRFVIHARTGMTFLGGLFGGGAVFLALHFFVGKRLFSKHQHSENFKRLLGIAPCCITVAHGFGRIGCLMGGCCYGLPTQSAIGVSAMVEGKYLPVQLFEAVFLFLLGALLIFLYLKNRQFNFPLYLVGYGAWRFVIEFFRGDERGSFVPGLSPSQLLSLLMLLGGAVWLVLFCIKKPVQKGGE